MTIHHAKDDPAVRQPEARAAIDGERASAAAVDAACTRRAVSVAEAVSMESLMAAYPQVAKLVEENDRLRDILGSVATDLEARCIPTARLEAATGRFMAECAERLRGAL